MSETTFIDIDEDDIQIHVCNNCGAYHESVEDIPHHATCKKGEAKRWEKFYSENNEEGGNEPW